MILGKEGVVRVAVMLAMIRAARDKVSSANVHVVFFNVAYVSVWYRVTSA